MKDMSIGAMGSLMPPAPGAVKPGQQVEGPGFGDVLKKSLNAVNEAKSEADGLVAGLVSGRHSNIHETMIALEKANISFRLLTKVQNKVLAAYQEIQRVPV